MQLNKETKTTKKSSKKNGFDTEKNPTKIATMPMVLILDGNSEIDALV